MKKRLFIFLSCVISIVLICAMFAACTDDEKTKNSSDKDPIIGTWLCSDTDDGSAYFVEISAKEYDENDKTSQYRLNWKMYRVFEWRDTMDVVTEDLNINPKYEGKYSLYCDFKTTYNIRNDYKIEMSTSDTFVVTGTYTDIYEKDLRLEFNRSSLTADQFETQYLNK